MSDTPVIRSSALIGAGLLLLLLWSVLDYGGRYLHVQVVAQALSGGMLLLGVLGQPTAYRRYPLLSPSLLLLGVLSFSWIFSVNRLASLEEILRYMMYLTIAWVVFCWAQTDELRQRLLKQIVAIGVLVCVMGWIQKPAARELVSTFHRTNDLAGYLLLLWPMALHQCLVTKERLWQLFYGLSALMFLVSLITTNSRGAWAIMLVTTIGLLVGFHRQRISIKSAVWGGAILGVGVSTVTWLNWATIGPRLNSLLTMSGENATAWRVSLLQGSLAIFKDHPILGSGPNTFSTIYHAYQQQVGYYSINPHNYYLQLLAEVGLAGALAFLILMVVALWTLWRQRWELLIPGILFSLVASLMQIGIEIAWSVSAIPILFFTLLGVGLATLSDTETESTAYHPLGRGVQAFAALVLVLLPLLNFFSVQAYVKASQLLEKQEVKAAEMAIKQAIQLAPWPSGRHHHLLGRTYLMQKDYIHCLQAANRAIQLDRYQSDYYLLTSQVLTALKEKKAALNILLQMIAVNPKRHPDLYAHIGDYYWLELHKPKEAQQWYQQAIDVFTPEALARYEGYTPTDRFQVFNIYRKMARLYQQQKNSKQEAYWEVQARQLLANTLPDNNLPEFRNTPFKAVQQYWLEWANWPRSMPPEQHFQSIMAEGKIQHPRQDMLIKPQSLRVLSAQRTIDTAEFLYQVQFKPKANHPNWMSITLHDQLMVTSMGWQIYQRQL